jgi:anti-sigma-K factor RskA
MAGPQLPNHKDKSTNEARFAQKNDNSYSGWSSAAVITITAIVAGFVFYVALRIS